MKRKPRDIQSTGRGIPVGVARATRGKAAEQLAAATVGVRKRADFGDLVGKWVPDSVFDEIMAAQRQVDSARWQ